MDLDAPKRKRIGWNYQNAFKTTPVEEQTITDDPIPIIPNDPLSDSPKLSNSSDEIEVIEVLETNKNTVPRPKTRPVIPAFTSRQEIKQIMRNTSQSNIPKFFKAKSPPTQDKKPITSNATVTSTASTTATTATASSTATPTTAVTPVTTATSVTTAIPVASVDTATTTTTATQDIPDNKKVTSQKEPKPSPENDLVNGHDDPLASRLQEEEEEEITSEFSKSVVEKFTERWRSLKRFTSDEERIKDKMWKNYYGCHTSYTHSRKFVNGVKKATDTLNQENLYVFISDIIDNLKRYKDVPFIEKEEDPDEWLRKKKVDFQGEDEPSEEVLDAEEQKKRRKMKKVEKEMIKLSKKINKLETAEVDLDDEVNSSYLILERLKNQFVKLDEYYCKLSNCVVSTGRPVEKKFKYEGSRYPEINQRITAWVNKNRCFPEYMDILKLVKNISKRNDLPLRPEAIRVQAQEIFRDVGKILKDRRERDDLFSIYAYATDTCAQDPAEEDPELKIKLKENEKNAKAKLDQVFQEFVDKEAEYRDKEEKKKSKKKEGNKGVEEEEKKKSEKEDKPEAKEESPKSPAPGTDVKFENTKESETGSSNKMSEEDDIGELKSLSTTEEEDENEDEEEDIDDDDDEDEEDVVSEDAGIAPEPTTQDDVESVDGEIELDDSDDEIQEILMAPVPHHDDEEEEEEEEEEYSSDEDVEIAPTPPIQFEDWEEPRKEPDLNGAVSVPPAPYFTHFKRKIDSEEAYFSDCKRKKEIAPEPEIVEID